jgi:hypothetical protein
VDSISFLQFQKILYLCKKLFNLMAATMTKRTAKRATAKATIKAATSKRLSKIGKWMRAHPKGDVEVLDWDAVLQ